MLKITQRAGENPEKLVQRFKRSVAKEGILKEIKKRRFFEKPSEARRRREREQVKQVRRRLRKQEVKDARRTRRTPR